MTKVINQQHVGPAAVTSRQTSSWSHAFRHLPSRPCFLSYATKLTCQTRGHVTRQARRCTTQLTSYHPLCQPLEMLSLHIHPSDPELAVSLALS